jgi:2',3'-cyclic-nucleotide 2'-phosphodiesterase/3'-nucleotidase/5'-nucleotidase
MRLPPRGHALPAAMLLLSLLFGSVAPAFAAPTASAPGAPLLAPAGAPAAMNPAIALKPIGTYRTGVFNESAAEIVAHDPISQTLYIVNAANSKVDVVSISNPASPTLLTSLDLSPYGSVVNSVDVHNGTVAVAVANGQQPGKVVFFSTGGQLLSQVTVGALPDMLTFTPDGTKVLVANEGEPDDTYTVDPEGSVTIIDVSGGAAGLTQASVTTVGFGLFNAGGPRHGELSPQVRIFGKNATVAQDLEPEYIAVSPDSATAWVTLQENNALAVINIHAMTVTQIVPLGSKNHNSAGNGLDASDRDNTINIAPWPVWGLYLPDAIAAYQTGGTTYLITANEGDSRDYDGYSEETRVGSMNLDATAFPNAAALKANTALGRLKATTANGDTDGDGDYDRIYTFGARSFSIWTITGTLVYDSGDDFERITAAIYPAYFNNDATGGFDSRSDDKGPEPEAVTTGVVNGRTYAFIGLERIGGIMVYDVTDPLRPAFVQYVNNRDFTAAPQSAAAGDLGPEGIIFIPAAQSPNGKPLLVVANEVSGTTTVYEVTDPNGAGSLTLLHNNDGESSLLPIQYGVAPGAGYPNTTTVTLDIGSTAAFKTLTDQQIRDARARGNAVVNVYAGDAFLASATLGCSLPPNPPQTPIYDAVAQRQIAYDAHILGNHEFDFSPDFLERFIRSFAINGVLTQPFLSANLGFGNEAGFADLLDADGLLTGLSTDGRVVARSAIVTDKITGQRFGIVGATTPQLPTISTARNVTVTANLTETATVAQQEIDRLYNDYNVRKIIFVSHLQDVENDKQLLQMLRRVDLAVAGGGDELLVSPHHPLTGTQLLPGETAPVAGTYPLTQADADGRTVYIVTTAGNYKYLGRLDVEFDALGEVSRIITETTYPRRVIPTSAAATQLGLADAVTPDPGIVATVNAPIQTCLNALANTTVATTEVLLDVSRNGSRSRETNAGNLIADSYIHAYDRLAAHNGLPPRGPHNPVIAVQNGGGIRQNAGDVLPVGGVVPGTISRKNTLDVLAFFNFMTVITNVTPADVKTFLERSAASLPGTGGQFLQVSGLTVTYNISRPVGSRVVEVSLADGTPIVRGGIVITGAPTLSVITNDFTASGGDNYPTFANNPHKKRVLDTNDFPITYEQAWREYMQSLPNATISANDPRYRPGGEGRIRIVRTLRYLPLAYHR